MAEQVRIDLIAEDKASKPIDQLAAKVADLENDKVKIPVAADTDAATHDIAGLMAKVDRLSAAPATLLLTTNATKIAGQIADLTADLDKLDAADPTVDVKSEQINQLTGDLDQIESKIKEVNNVPVDIDTKPVTKSLDDVGKSANSSKSVLANLVGNATQDVGALAGVAGSAGVAIGQMGEYMVDAKNDGDKLGDVLRNFGKIAVPIAAITVATAAIGSIFQAIEDRAKRAQEQVKAFTNNLGDTASAKGAIEGLVGQLQRFDADARTAWGGFLDGVAGAVKAIPVLGGAVGDAGQNITNLIPVFNKLGITAEDVGAAAAKGGTAWDELRVSVAAAGEAGQITSDQASALDQKLEELEHSAKKANDTSLFLNGSLEDQAKAASTSARETAELQVATDRAARAATDAARAWDDLEGSLDIDQAVADVGTAFDDMKTKAQEAWDKTAAGADDAKEAQDVYAQSVRDAKRDVETLGRQIGLSIPDVKKMLLQIDNGNLEDVQRQIDIMARNRTMELSIIAKGGPGYGTQTGGISGPRSMPPAPPVAAPVTNVTVHVPRGTRPDDMVRAADRYARRNGRARAYRR